MTCAEALDRLDELVDGELPEEEGRQVEAHLSSCPSCRDEARRLRAILAEAHALPREMAAPRDLWPEIAQEIASQKVVSPTFERRPRSWWAPALAAAAVLAAVASLLLMRAPGMPGAGPIAGTPVPAAAGRVTLLDAERGYALAAEELLAALDARRESLSPETRESVRRNLEMIDQALQQIREALEREPKNPELTRMLASTHRRKVDVLRRVVRLSGASL